MSLAARIGRSDFFRRSPGPRGDVGHKEWQHFLVHGPTVKLLINFSLADAHRLDGRPSLEVGRLIVIACTADGWRGTVDRFSPDAMDVRSGRIDARLGESAMIWRGDAWHLRLRCPRVPLAADLVVRPTTWPASSANIPMAPGRRLNWLIVARAEARGTVRLDGQLHRLEGAPAYHDHNWGHFAWGDDFAWEWGSALPDDPACPYSAVFVRMADRGRRRIVTQGLFLWRGASQHRVLQDRALAVEAGPPLRLSSMFKLPPVMGLLAPGHSADVPETLRVEAAAGADRLRLEFRPTAVCQVLIPDEADALGVTRLNEAYGAVRLEGVVRDEPVAFEGTGVFEFVRG